MTNPTDTAEIEPCGCGSVPIFEGSEIMGKRLACICGRTTRYHDTEKRATEVWNLRIQTERRKDKL